MKQSEAKSRNCCPGSLRTLYPGSPKHQHISFGNNKTFPSRNVGCSQIKGDKRLVLQQDFISLWLINLYFINEDSPETDNSFPNPKIMMRIWVFQQLCWCWMYPHKTFLTPAEGILSQRRFPHEHHQDSLSISSHCCSYLCSFAGTELN